MSESPEPRVCEHLRPVEAAVCAAGARRTFAGRAWSRRCRHFVYYDAVLDTEALRDRLALPQCVVVHDNADPRSGVELGLYCEEHEDAVMGRHPSAPRGPIVT